MNQLKNNSVKLIKPLSYIDTIQLLKNAIMLLTDSGGMQKEAYFPKSTLYYAKRRN